MGEWSNIQLNIIKVLVELLLGFAMYLYDEWVYECRLLVSYSYFMFNVRGSYILFDVFA